MQCPTLAQKGKKVLMLKIKKERKLNSGPSSRLLLWLV